MGKRGTCWHGDRDTCLLLQVATFHRMQRPLSRSNCNQKSSSLAVSSSNTHVLVSLLGPTLPPFSMLTEAFGNVNHPTIILHIMASWWPVGCLVWSTSYTSQEWCPGKIGESRMVELIACTVGNAHSYKFGWRTVSCCVWGQRHKEIQGLLLWLTSSWASLRLSSPSLWLLQWSSSPPPSFSLPSLRSSAYPSASY